MRMHHLTSPAPSSSVITGASVATTRENTHTPSVTNDGAAGGGGVIVELPPNRSHESGGEGKALGGECACCTLRFMSHVTCHMSHVTPLTSFLLPLTAPPPPSSAGVVASAVEVHVQEQDGGGGSQGPGLESQSHDLNDADQTKCMPCAVM